MIRARQFCSLISAALVSGKCHILDKRTGKHPPDSERWGWREEQQGLGSTVRARGPSIGWIEEDDLYLEPEAAFAEAQRLAREQGAQLPVTKNTLWKRLKEAGALASFDAGKNLKRVSIGQDRRTVVHLSAKLLVPLSPKAAPVAPDPQFHGGSGTSNPAPESKTPAKQGQKAGPEGACEVKKASVQDPLNDDPNERPEGFYV